MKSCKASVFVFSDYKIKGGAENVANTEYELLNNDGQHNVFFFAFSTSHFLVDLIRLFIVCINLAISSRKHKTIVHIHNFCTRSGLLFLLVLVLMRRFFNVKVIHTVHDYLLVTASRDGLAYADGRVVNVYERRDEIYTLFDQRKLINLFIKLRASYAVFMVGKLKVFDVLLTPSLHLRDSLIQKFDLDCRVLRNPIKTLKNSPNSDIDSGKKYFIIGRLTHSKGVLESFEYWNTTCEQDGTLSVIGSGDLKSELEALVISKSLQDKVQFIDWIEHRAVLTMINRGFILFGSIWTENAPVVFLDAFVSDAYILPLSDNSCVKEFKSEFPEIFVENTKQLPMQSKRSLSNRLCYTPGFHLNYLNNLVTELYHCDEN